MTCITGQQWRLQPMPGGRPDMETKGTRGGQLRRPRLPMAFAAAAASQLLPPVAPNDEPAQSRAPCAAHPPPCPPIVGRLRLSAGVGPGHRSYAPAVRHPPIPCAPCDPPAGPIARQCASGSRVQADHRCYWRRAGIARRSYGIVLTSAFCRDSTNAKSPYAPMRSRKRGWKLFSLNHVVVVLGIFT